ncbi:hypothetical protein ABW21_db0201117 [Orbilia brochopaga]|nr:hypothetical protein ABW21_db0201117 [Drechslerella brochopaga]
MISFSPARLNSGKGAGWGRPPPGQSNLLACPLDPTNISSAVREASRQIDSISYLPHLHLLPTSIFSSTALLLQLLLHERTRVYKRYTDALPASSCNGTGTAQSQGGLLANVDTADASRYRYSSWCCSPPHVSEAADSKKSGK